MSNITLAGIFHYPIKSCSGTALNEANLDVFGLQNDRHWMVVDVHGQFLTQRELPRMALVEPTSVDDGLHITAPDMDSLRVATPSESANQIQVTVWRSTCVAADAGDEAASWFSDFLKISCRLVGVDSNYRRHVNPAFAIDDDQVNFADGYPLLLTNSASLDDLNARMASPVPMSRFRTNLLVSGPEPFAEDRWKTIKIGETTLYAVKPCARCAITTVDQTRGERGKEPLATLASFRQTDDGNILFGQNLIHTPKQGSVRVGDVVQVLDET